MSEWCFHDAQWGDLKVFVMPLTTPSGVEDSNTGIVLEAPYHGTLIGKVVVNNGRRPLCDLAPLNFHITGNRLAKWSDVQRDVYSVPKLKMEESNKNASYRRASELAGVDMANEVLGWGCYSLKCEACMVMIPSDCPEQCLQDAQAYGWGLDQKGKPVCPAHAIYSPLPCDYGLQNG